MEIQKWKNTWSHKEGGIGNENIRCRKQIDKLYGRSRCLVTAQDKNIFKLPVKVQKKKGVESISLWIEMVKMLFQVYESKIETKIVYWMFPQKSEWLETFNTYMEDTSKEDELNCEIIIHLDNG